MNEQQFKKWAAENPNVQRPDLLSRGARQPSVAAKLRMFAGLPLMFLAICVLRILNPKLGSSTERVALWLRRTAYRVAGKEWPQVTAKRYIFRCETCQKDYQCGSDFVTDLGIVCLRCGKVTPEFGVETIVLG